MAIDPIQMFNRLFRRAARLGHALPEAMALATADRDGEPSVRYVLLKEATPRGFVFYTDTRSPKGQTLRSNPRASAVFYWHELGKQVRLTGRIEPVSAAEADAYWASRPRESQISGQTSQQSQPIASHRLLVQRWKKTQQLYRDRSVPRPPDWSGYRIVPDRIEFWTRGAHRLHQRILFERRRGGWKQTLLQP